MRLAGDVEYYEWDFFDIKQAHWCFVCRWHQPEDELVQVVASYFDGSPEEKERHFLREKAWETYARQREKATG